ncbi:hypothetical protein GCM10007874_43540 [Labrys miyagiensis]|uniref:Uncharacterized protein n=1 Tax=Labrys miyagiensis TaxID=346912 RepID=A0ABQ6CP14_9HYPH|nr:hypothetical protein GCM10007874_43540 [Labrys miyagiensis]
MDGPDLATQALHREDGRGIADMAVGDPGLDGEDIHVTTGKAGEGLADETITPLDAILDGVPDHQDF